MYQTIIASSRLLAALAAVFTVWSLARAEMPPAVRAAAAAISADELLRETSVLASDEFEGRAPGTAGEEKAVQYLVKAFQADGLEPGNPDGSWIQTVPLVGIRAEEVAISYDFKGARTELAFPGECVVWSKRVVPAIAVTNAEVVFVGYGVVAPEYGWDDFKGMDVRGKTILMLVNDPAVPDPTDPGQLDPHWFKGRAMTYYGRWTYKFEAAAAKGAAAAIIVHEQGPAGYPWVVVVGSSSRENFDLRRPDGGAGRVPVEGWMTLTSAQKLCAASGLDFASLKQAARRQDFRPVPLGATMSFALRNQIREVASRNVVARRTGIDPALRDEFVVLTAHWDHLGRDPLLAGDQIYNGALDNATGSAGLIALGRAFGRPGLKPKRSLLFLGLTGEEKGLLGAAHYAAQPLYPLARTVANLNMDGLNPYGRTADVEVIGWGNNSLEDWLAEAAQGQGRTVTADSEPEKGRYFRSDHFEFAKVGVPALYFKGGTNALDHPAGYLAKRGAEYTSRDYHKVTDDVKPYWDLRGAAQDVELIFLTAWRAANEPRWPEWKAGSEFKARREEMLRAARDRRE